MYELYVEKCKTDYVDAAYKSVSSALYRQIFNEDFNLGFYKPKKDQCAECEKYDLMSATEKEQYRPLIEQHQARNKEAQTDKQRAKDDIAFQSISFDLQSVLQVHSPDVLLLYYKRKLCCYNLTVYEQAEPHDANCYLWSEAR